MDATQQLEDSFLEEEDDSDNEHDQAEGKIEREPLAVLKVFKNNYMAETEIPLYPGENILGRDTTSCSVPLQARSVSGHHAIISISVFGPKDQRAHIEHTEALLWDLGSLNGTRKGRSKLTPHVRYVLTDGDSVVLADLPCQYVSLKNAEGNAHTPNSEKVNGPTSPSSSREGETVKEVANSGKASALPSVTVWCGDTKSFQLPPVTPKQPETTLVPESDSDSDGEKHGKRNRRRVVASDSVSSDLSSPTCSTFLTPATKIIPESEDERFITPSPALKGSFQKPRNGTEVSSGSSKPDPLHLDINSDTDVEDDGTVTTKATSGTEASVPAEVSALNPADLHMDSDTYVEEEEVEKVKSDPEASALAPAKQDPVHPAALNMDSDTDNEDDDVEMMKVTTASEDEVAEEVAAVNAADLHIDSDTDVEEEAVKHDPEGSALAPEEQDHVNPAALNMDSDTDHEDDGVEMMKVTTASESGVAEEVVAVNAADLHMDSDTDVEEEAVKHDPEASELAPAKQDHVNPAALNMDSDTDVEEDGPVITNAASCSGPAAVLEEIKDTAMSAQYHMESDTDVDEEVPCIQPRETDNNDQVAQAPKMLHPESDSDTDVEDDVTEIRTPTVVKETGKTHSTTECSTDTWHDGPIRAQPPADALRDEFRLDSDTDVDEDEEKMDEQEPKCAEAAVHIVHSSTPRGSDLSEEEKETQAFLSPSRLFKRPGLPSLLPPSVSPGGVSHTDDDFAVAETQSFMCSAAQADAVIDETPQSPDDFERQRSDKALSLQLDLFDSTHLTEAEEHDREPVAEDWQLQATQLYDSNSTKAGQTPLDLDATQVYTDSVSQEEEEDGRKDEEEMKTQHMATVSCSSAHGEAQLINHGAQNENPDEQDSNEKFVPEAQERKDEGDARVETQVDSHLSTADTLLIVRSPRHEEQTQLYTFVAEKIQEATEKEEHKSRDQEVQLRDRGIGTQNEMMGHVINNEREMKEHEAVANDAKNYEVQTQAADDETQPMCEKKNVEQLNEPSSSSGSWPAQVESGRCIKADHHTHTAGAFAETMPMGEDEEEQEEVENDLKNSRRVGMRTSVKVKQSVRSDKVTHVTLVETMPLCEEDKERQEEQTEAMSSRRSSMRRLNAKARPTKCDERHLTIPETLPMFDQEEEPQSEARSVRKSQRVKKTAKLEATQPLDTDSTTETVKMEEKEEEPDSRQSLRGKSASGKGRGRGRGDAVKDMRGKRGTAEQEKDSEEEVDGGNKGRVRKRLRKKSNNDKTRLELKEVKGLKKQEDEEESQSLQQEKKEDEAAREESIRLNKEMQEREEHEKGEQEENDKLERERIGQEKAREEKERIERAMKEKFERELEKERSKQERIERENKEKKEMRERGEWERKKQEEPDRLTKEKEMRDENEKQENRTTGRRKAGTKRERSMKDDNQELEGTKERKKLKPELSDEQKQECKEGISNKQEEEPADSDMKPRRGRRTATKSVAPPASMEDEGGPAKRTRSRSNSSNSVCSEQSTQDSLNEGRSLGRRTITVPSSEKESTKQAAHSRSNFRSSERSSSSMAAQSQGRGANMRTSMTAQELEEEKVERKQSTAVGRGRGGKRPSTNAIKAKAADDEDELMAVAPGDRVMSQSSSSRRKRGSETSTAETAQLTPKTLRRSSIGPTHKVLFTGVEDEDGEKVVMRLGGVMAKGVSDMTHLVTDKVRRTVKFLCAVARGVPIVTPDWLSKCGKAGSFLSPNGFLVDDVEQEKRFNFSLQDTLRVASSQPLLQGYEIYVTPSVKPEPAHMKEIVTCCGARFLHKMPSAHKAQVVVVSCEEDRALCERAQKLSFPVVSAEFLLTGILQQKVDTQTHALSLSPPASVPRPNARKRRK